MALITLCALITLSGSQQLGKPVAEHTYYFSIEKALPDGTPDLKATGNHWMQLTEEYYALVDTRTMQRDADSKIHLPELNFDFKMAAIPYKQQGRAPAGLGPEFHYVIAPSGLRETKFTYPAYDVSPSQEFLEYLIKMTTVETEVRLVNKRRVTRTQTTEGYGSAQVGLGPHESYDPVTQKRFKV